VVGLIDSKCSPAEIAADAIDHAVVLCRDAFGVAPEVVVQGNKNLTFPYASCVFVCLKCCIYCDCFFFFFLLLLVRYVKTHLFYMMLVQQQSNNQTHTCSHHCCQLQELLKNSLRATVEFNGPDAALPDIKVIIAHSLENEDVAIKVRLSLFVVCVVVVVVCVID
jgi:hypothetical protein